MSEYTKLGSVCAKENLSRRSGRFTWFQIILLSIVAFGMSFAVAGAETKKTMFHIEAQPAKKSLTLYARQARVQLGFAAEVADDVVTNAVVGEYENNHALELLLDGTGLEAELGERGLVIRRTPKPHRTGGVDEPPAAVAETTSLRLTPTSMLAATQASTTIPGAKLSVDDDREKIGEVERELEEIVVTGTHIRGAGAVGANVLVIDRFEIDKTGLSTTQEVLQTVPQYFGAGPTESTLGSFNAKGDLNQGKGSGVNLRGLGADSTLVLLNGRRVAPSGRGTFVDLSQFPLSAVERMEVLTDGASAIYGSDAIGGVVNVVLRKDFDGAETRLRTAPDTGNDVNEFQFVQTLGKSWKSGYVMLNYEFLDRDPLQGFYRDYYRNDLTPFGGDDFRGFWNNPGNITRYTLADGTRQSVQFVIPTAQDGTALDPADLVVGQNLQDFQGYRYIMPGQKRHSAFLTFGQRLTATVEGFAEVLYSKRDAEYSFGTSRHTLTVPSSHPFFVDPFGGSQDLQLRYSYADDYGSLGANAEAALIAGTIGATTDISESWQATLSGTFSKDTTSNNSEIVNRLARNVALADLDPSTVFNPFGDGSHTNPATLQSMLGFSTRDVEAQVNSLRVVTDGSVFRAGGGPAKLAIGAEYREEDIENVGVLFTNTPAPVNRESIVNGRSVSAAFAELYLPFVSNENRRPGLEALEVSLAARFEDYSDFGTTTNPKIGIRWSPAPGFNIRATFSESFKAPLLEQLVDAEDDRIFFTFAIADPTSATGFTDSLVLRGNNPELQPEEAETFTFGLDLKPEGRDVSLELTYFDIDIKDKIADLQDAVFIVLEQEDVYAPVITRCPCDSRQVSNFFANSRFSNSLGLTPNEVEAIIDFRLNNVSVTKISGLDLGFQAGWDTAAGQFNVAANASYFFTFEDAISETAAKNDVLGTVNHPVTWRARGEVSWNQRGWGIATFVNYVDSYINDDSDPQQRVSSWTTADLSVRYQFADRATWWSNNVTVALSAQNVFDRPPPFVNNQILRVGYDPENANARGRVLALQLTKRW